MLLPSSRMSLAVVLCCILHWWQRLVVEAQPQQLHRKFEYKHSFRSPNLAQRDGSVIFWTVSGDAIASSEQLRLAPSMRSRKGAAWNARAMTESEFWEVEFSIKVTGQGRVGADGLAFWYTAAPGVIGPVFGSNDYWTGLGIFFDSFDNDGQKNNPYMMMMINDGTRAYDHQSDGSRQALNGCQKDFRNRPFPVKVKVEYLRNVLTVYVHDGMAAHDRYELCMRSENIFLPRNGYFGMSAATGGLADDHDVLAFSTFSLMTEAPRPPSQIPQDERKKYDDEFDRQWQEFQQEKEKFRKEHPDKAKPDDDLENFAQYFEDATARELRLVYESQNAIHQVMQQMEAKLQQIVQAQNSHTQMLQARGGAAPAGGVQQGAGGAAAGGFQRHEVNEVMQLSREMSGALRDMKNYVNEIYTRTFNLEQRFAGGGGAAVPAGGAAGSDQFHMQTMRGVLDGIKQDVEQVRANQRGQGGAPCPPVSTTCLTSSFFLVIIAVQTAALVVVAMLRRGSDKAKFY